jgi:hypothetical protein
MNEHCEEVEVEMKELARVYKFVGWSKDLPGGTFWIEGNPYVAGEAGYVQVTKLKQESKE